MGSLGLRALACVGLFGLACAPARANGGNTPPIDAATGADVVTGGDVANGGDVPVVPDAAPSRCRDDSTCGGATPRCDLTRGACVGCTASSHCASGQVCAGQRCVAATPCTTARMCPGQVCETARGVCVDCVGDNDCAADQQCRENLCVARPRPCRSSRECSDLGLVCDLTASRCVECVADADCPGQLCASGNVCRPRACEPNARTCASDTAARVCDARGAATTDTPCATGERCATGQCRRLVCTPNARSCADGTTVRACAADGFSEASTPCAAGQSCREGACVARVCTPGATECVGTAARRVCAPDGLAWTSTDCASSQVCSGGACVARVCTPGVSDCESATAARRCNADALSYTRTPCASDATCMGAGVCTPRTCTPGTSICLDATAQRTCNADGFSYTTVACGAMQGCQSGACRAWTCTPGTSICETSTVVARCNADGFTRTTTSCPAVTNGSATCASGTCGVTCNAGYVLQAGTCVAAGTAVRPLSPLSPARVGPRPTFTWQAPTGTNAVVEVCANRACTVIEAMVPGVGGSARVATPLRNGAHYWRVQTAGGVSTVWEFFVSPRVTESANARGPATDLDGDGFQDLYAAAPGATGLAGMTFYGRAGDLDETPVRVTGSACVAPQAAADINGDGYGDIVCLGDFNGGSVRVLPGGAGRPTAAATATGISATQIAAGFDVTGDGYGDVVACVGHSLRVYEGSPTGLVRSTLPDISPPSAVADIFGSSVALVGDMDGDGYPEVAVGSRSPDNMRGEVDIYRGLPRGFASTPYVTIGRPGGGTGSMGSRVTRLGDVNGDGLADLGVFAGQSLIAPGLYVFVGVRGGPPSTTPWFRRDFGNEESINGDGDVNGDGYDDVVIQPTTNATQFWVMRGGASLGAVLFYPSATMPPNYYFATITNAAHDLDGDGYDDVVARDAVINDHPGRLFLYRGGSAPAATPWKILDGRALGVTGSYPSFGQGLAMSLGRWRFRG